MNTGPPLGRILAELERAGIEHMLAGSLASTYHGDPRTTHDIDLVIRCDKAALDQFVGHLDPGSFYVSSEAADEAWRRRGQFNVVLLDSGWKVDLILCKDRAFSKLEFSRRQRSDVAGTSVWIATAEDTVVAKLEWSKAGESERQLRDVVGILKMRNGALDLAYIEHWTYQLGLAELWERAQALSSG